MCGGMAVDPLIVGETHKSYFDVVGRYLDGLLVEEGSHPF